MMSCSVAIAGSPVFSPSRMTHGCKSSPETLALTLLHASAGEASPCSCSAAGSSPFRQRFQRPLASGLRAVAKEMSFAAASTAAGVECSPSSGLDSSSGRRVSMLKRKRPAKINIPTAAEELVFAGVEGSDGRREVEEESETYSVFCKRGRKRSEMEDRYKAAVDLRGDSQSAFFGIFDGHGGAEAAQLTSEKMGDFIVEEMMVRGERETEEAVRIGYLKTDEDFLKKDLAGGACCVTALVRNGDLIVSNAGDCRAVLSRSGTAEALTVDHRPSREDERDRIENLGGFVNHCRGVWRLQGCLAVSRGIGDSHLKPFVTPEPETKVLRIKPEYEFLILASDGLWDKVSNQEAVDIARPFCMDAEKPSLLSACKMLAELSAVRGSMDDISVLIVQLGHLV